MVYFISGAGKSPIKIGTSQDPEDRCKRLARQRSEELHVQAVLPGYLGVERALHRRFAQGRIDGEWFAYDTPGLLDFIRSASHFEGFWPDDQDSSIILDVLEVLHAGNGPIPQCGYEEGWR